MTLPLKKKLADLIRMSGPMPVSDYMRICLSDPDHGYYATRDPFGETGDFTTAPEISQMFGELIGLWLVQVWADQGAPDPFCLAELGPGRGTLMADILRASRVVPAFAAAAQVSLVETSPELRSRQAEALDKTKVNWLDTVDDLPELPLYLVANEFFDALPIRQFHRTASSWRELMLGLSESELSLGLGEEFEYPQLQSRLEDTRPGDIVEICPAASEITTSLANRIACHGGAALIVDYGDAKSLGDTFQALRKHLPVSLTEFPGDSDLTAHVDFGALADAAANTNLKCSALTPQGIFLERLGITTRAQKLAQTLTGKALEAHIAAHSRLTHPKEMGTVFKVLGMTRTDAPPLPGLTP